MSPWLPVALAAWHECAQSILGRTGFKEIRGEHLTGSSLSALLTTVVTSLNKHDQVRIVDAWTAVVNRMAEEALAQVINSGIVRGTFVLVAAVKATRVCNVGPESWC